MHDCTADVLAFHDEQVTLPNDERGEMRKRRDANRTRLRTGLKGAGRPKFSEFKSQGSYAMKTMTQHPTKDYDIDDGVYFEKEVLVGERGAEMSALDVRQMVRDSLDDKKFKTPPVVRTNCVRVLYDEGYHVDLPIYRVVRSKNSVIPDYCELASSDWKRSDARDVTAWFDEVNEQKSPDTENGRQFRRITRLVKKFGKSRRSWEDQVLSGFGITVLVSECFRSNAAREDVALYETMCAMKGRLDSNLVVKHPVTPNETITDGVDDAAARFLRDRLADATAWLQPLLEPRTDRKTALNCWDKAFFTKYFVDRAEQLPAQPRGIDAGLLKSLSTSTEARAAVKKDGGGRYA